jgi:hypothetical protein
MRGCLSKLDGEEFAETPLTRRFASASPRKRGEAKERATAQPYRCGFG